MKLFTFPGNIEPSILDIGAEQVPYARTQSFGELIKSCELDLLRLADCSKGRVVQLTASGTAAMEAVVSNLLVKKSNVLVLNGGTFGQRWVDIIKLYPHKKLTILNLSDRLKYKKIKGKIDKNKYDFVFMQHHETSTGLLYNIKKIGKICSEKNIIFIVDIIGSFLADFFSMRKMFVDIAITSSHKGLCLPPGLAFILLSEQASKFKFHSRNLYLNFDLNLKSLERGQALFSPAALIFKQLRARLDTIQKACESVKVVEGKALFFREQLKLNNKLFKENNCSNALTTIQLECESLKVRKMLNQDQYYTMPGVKSNELRIGHLGAATKKDHAELLSKILFFEKTIVAK